MTQNPMEPESGELAAGQSLADLLAKELRKRLENTDLLRGDQRCADPR